MRTKDHKSLTKLIAAINKIKPLCTGKAVKGITSDAGEIIPEFAGRPASTYRLLVNWKGKKVRCGLVLGYIENGEPHMSNVGLMCLDQWMTAHPSQQIVFAEFRQVATGNISRLKDRLAEHLDKMVSEIGDNAVLLLACKNSVMYDKVGALIDITGNANSPHA